MDWDFVRQHTEDIDTVIEAVRECTPEWAETITSVPAQDIRTAARLYATTDKAGIYYTLGITEHICGVDNVRSLSNLALITGHVGQESAGVNPLRGQNNVQGCNDMGNNPTFLPGYQLVENDEERAKFSKAWGVELSAQPGKRLDQMMSGMHDGSIRAFFIMGEDPIVSEPNCSHVEEGFRKMDFTVCQDIFLNETARLYADVVLPASCFAEKSGTFTNSERRVQRVRCSVDPPGQARTDLSILLDVARRLGHDWGADEPQRIWEEVASLCPKFAGIQYFRIEDEGIQWPCPDPSHPGTKFLHQGAPIRGKGLLYAVDHVPPAEEPCEEYPMLLTTGRTLYHYNAATMTRRSEGNVQKQEHPFVEISPADALEFGFKQGEMVQMQSRRGTVQVQARITDRLHPGVLWMGMHFVEARVNLLTGDGKDPEVGVPEYKVTAVRLFPRS